MPSFQRFRRIFGNPRLALFVMALLARLVFFVIMSVQLPASRWPTLTPDSTAYTQAAAMIANNGSFQSSGVATFGPGYPLFLAVVRSAVEAPAAVILLQILLGSAATVLLGRLAFVLTGEIRIAVAAGLLNALSLSSISLANIYLSETLFFFLTVSAVSLIVSGIRDLRWQRILPAAPLLVAAVYTKSMLEHFWPVLLFSAALYLWPQRAKNGRNTLVTGAAVFGVIMVMLLGSHLWERRNERLYGVDTVSMAQPIGKMKMAAKALANVQEITYDEAYADLTARAERQAADSAWESQFAALASVSDSALGSLVRDHPVTFTTTLLHSIRGGVTSGWGVHYIQLPRWNGDLRHFTSWLYKKGLNYRGALLTLIGAGMLAYRRRYRLLAILVMFYGYFALAAGFGQYQGNRLFYAGQLGWTILSAYPLAWLYARISDLINRND